MALRGASAAGPPPPPSHPHAPPRTLSTRKYTENSRPTLAERPRHVLVPIASERPSESEIRPQGQNAPSIRYPMAETPYRLNKNMTKTHQLVSGREPSAGSNSKKYASASRLYRLYANPNNGLSL
ncbi:hypothetical protein KGM_212024 [Danaus plexippus plexippus]|uniref:Uncharacterized protein n=1 Tax=Danaus plexippus plexippus TaxID=278856 RepID=A0A212F7S4_DANPL|nr:hypothetical protein KGM_212024 [Danaus plexippus plexippus]